MADFNHVHRHSLSNAMAALQRQEGNHWNIIVLEPLIFNAPMEESAYYISVIIGRDGKLHPANEISETIIQEWKERHKNTPNSSFEPWLTKPSKI